MDVKGAQALADRIAEAAKNVVASPAGSSDGEDTQRSALARGCLAEQVSLEPPVVNKTI